ncbi:MAG: hypothetical protein WDM96_00095 [Lacunisphaera sp.]
MDRRGRQPPRNCALEALVAGRLWHEIARPDFKGADGDARVCGQQDCAGGSCRVAGKPGKGRLGIRRQVEQDQVGLVRSVGGLGRGSMAEMDRLARENGLAMVRERFAAGGMAESSRMFMGDSGRAG